MPDSILIQAIWSSCRNQVIVPEKLFEEVKIDGTYKITCDNCGVVMCYITLSMVG